MKLYTADPVRDRGWWARTLLYLFTLVAQQVASGFEGQPWTIVAGVVTVVLCGVAVFLRDRFPWLLASLGLALGATTSETPIALGVAAVASRARWPITLGYSLIAAVALALPWQRAFNSGLAINYDGPSARMITCASTAVILIVLPGLIGTLRRTSRESGLQRLEFEAQQRRLSSEQAVMAERNRIAQEMHDVLGHKLSLITLQAGALQVNAGGEPAAIERQADLIRQTSRQALDELREILGVLGERPDDHLHPQPGLTATLTLIEHNQASGMRINLSNELAEGVELPANVGLAIHRLVQEGLTNARRHAPGAAIDLTIAPAGDQKLRVELTNRPSAQPSAGPGTGRGLAGLQERVRAAGGSLDAGATAEGGYRLSAELPWPKTENETGKKGDRGE